MPTQWAVVADEGRARVFARVGSHGGWQDIDDISHKRRSPVNDGREVRLPLMSPRLRAKTFLGRSDARNFTQFLAEFLGTARKRGDFDQLRLIAPAGMLEALRNALDPATRRKLVDAYEGDMVGMPLKTTRRQLARLF
jgi:protein required for attachment to host cells